MKLALLVATLIVGIQQFSLAAESPKKQQPAPSIVLNGQLLPSKGRIIDGILYINAAEAGASLNWKIQISDTTAVINTLIATPAKADVLPTGTIYGVVTYLFNKNIGTKPDVGAEVFLIESEDGFYPSSTDMLIPFTPKLTFKRKAGEEKQYPVVATTLTDGSGRYEFRDVKPGNYAVIIVSAHTKSVSELNFRGNIYFKNAKISAGDKMDISKDFGASSI